ncbi:MAG TPA: hypothetical protein VMT88_14060 [Actinomycetes bacterium]|nr:hypothetical protein [Actinomycetes bacterium]
MFTHPAAALAFNVGEATDVARVAAGRAAVAVPPMVMAVGLTFIAGTVGDEYVPAVDESPDPPATFCGLEAPGCVRTVATAAMMAKPPSPAERRVSRCVCMDYLQQPTESLTSDRPLLIRRISIIEEERFFELRVRFYVGNCSQSIVRRPFKGT